MHEPSCDLNNKFMDDDRFQGDRTGCALFQRCLACSELRGILSFCG